MDNRNSMAAGNGAGSSSGTYTINKDVSPRDNSLTIGTRLYELVRTDWKEYVIDYAALTTRLVDVKHTFGLRRVLSSASITGETRSFAEILDKEVEKVVLFYIRQQGHIAEKLWNLRCKDFSNLVSLSSNTSSSSSSSSSSGSVDINGCTVGDIEAACQQYRMIGREVLDLLQYLNVNVVALRKILRQHDKYFQLHMSSLYFNARIGTGNKQSAQLLQLYHQEGLRAIIETLHRGFEELYELKQTYNLLNSDNPLLMSEQHQPFIQSTATSLQYKSAALPASTSFNNLQSLLQDNRELSNKLILSSSKSKTSKNNSLSPSYVSTAAGVASGYLSRVKSFNLLSSIVSSDNTNNHPGSGPATARSSGVTASTKNNTNNTSVIDLSVHEPILALLLLAADKVLEIQQQTTEEYSVMHSEMGLVLNSRAPYDDDYDLYDDLDDDDDDGGGGGGGRGRDDFDVLGELIERGDEETGNDEDGFALYRNDVESSQSSNAVKRRRPSLLLPATSYNDLLSLADGASNSANDSDTNGKYQSVGDGAGKYDSMSAYNITLKSIRSSHKQQQPQKQQQSIHKRSPYLINLYLTLVVSFLYQANQYVISPTSGLYAQKLGLSPSLSAAIVGTAPLAALVSAVYYSYISNYNYKAPLLMCLVCLFVGNLLYAMALQLESPSCLFVGRMLAGFGGPRGLVRRYIADHIPRQHRNRASAMFVNSGCLGLAVGPLLASLLSAYKHTFSFDICAASTAAGDTAGTCWIKFEEVTAPGWIMGVMFGLCLVALLGLFTEPNIHRHSKQAKAKHAHNDVGLVSSWQLYLETIRESLQKWACCCGCLGKADDKEAVSNSQKSKYGALSTNDDDVDDSKLTVQYEMVTCATNEWLDQRDDVAVKGNDDVEKSCAPDKASTSCAGDSERLRLRADSFGGGFGQYIDPTPSPRNNSASSSDANNNSSNLTSSASPSPNKQNPSTDDPMKNLSSSWLSRAPPKLYWWNYLSREVAVILFMYFINKIGQEIVVNSVPTIGTNVFAWDSQLNGIFMCVCGAVVLPATLMVNTLTKTAEDRNVVWGLSWGSIIWYDISLVWLFEYISVFYKFTVCSALFMVKYYFVPFGAFQVNFLGQVDTSDTY
jgi:hypothetical protein